MGLDVSGTGALKVELQTTNQKLDTTNELLSKVLAELKTMNGQRLGAVQASVELLNTQVGVLSADLRVQQGYATPSVGRTIG